MFTSFMFIYVVLHGLHFLTLMLAVTLFNLKDFYISVSNMHLYTPPCSNISISAM